MGDEAAGGLVATVATRDGRRLSGEVVELTEGRLVLRSVGQVALLSVAMSEVFRATIVAAPATGRRA